METKICATCGRELTLDHFAKNHYGIAKSCKECNGKKIADGRAYKKKVSELERQIEEMKSVRLNDFTPRERQSEAYLELQTKVVSMWCGKKKDRDKALKDIMHGLLDKGRINTKHDEIDKR